MWGSTSFQDDIEPFRLPLAASPGRHTTFVPFTATESVAAVSTFCAGGDGDGDGDGDGGAGAGLFGRTLPKIRPGFARVPSNNGTKKAHEYRVVRKAR